MILKKMIIENFRQFRFEEIEFANDSNKNFTIIKGTNGAGKTNIMNAFSWCLYGAEYFNHAENLPIFNINTSKDLAIGEKSVVSVKILMEDSKGRDVYFIREAEFFKDKSSKCSLKRPSCDILLEDIPVTFHTVYISKFLPNKIREYFLFDGEQLENYFREDNRNFKITVKRLSQLNLLERISHHIHNREDGYINELKQLNPSSGKILKRINDYNKRLEDNGYQLKEITKNMNRWNNQIYLINEKLISDESVEKIMSIKKELSNLIKREDKKLEKLYAERRKHILTNYPYVLSYSAFINFLKYYDEEKDIPTEFKSIIQDLLDKDSSKEEFKKELEKLLDEKNNLSDDEKEISVDLNHIKEVIIKDINNFKLNSLKLHYSIKESEDKLEKLRLEYKECIEFLESNTSDEVKGLLSQKRKYENLIINSSRKVDFIKSKNEIIKKDLKKYEKEVVRENKNIQIVKEIEENIKFCRDVDDFVKDLSASLEEDILFKLQNLTNENFNKLQFRSHISNIILNNNYQLYLQSNFSKENVNGLFWLDKLILAISFMFAIHEVIGMEIPIFMDSFLGKSDTDIKKNILKELPQMAGNNQVILFLTNSEYENISDNLLDKVGKNYSIEIGPNELYESKVVL